MVAVSYRDLLIEIDILEMRLDDLERTRRYFARMLDTKPRLATVDYTTERVTGDFPHMPLDRIVDTLNKIDRQIEETRALIARKERIKETLERDVSEFEQLENKVAYMRDVQGKGLYQIAGELGYSYSYIRKISMKTKKRHSFY